MTSKMLAVCNVMIAEELGVVEDIAVLETMFAVANETSHGVGRVRFSGELIDGGAICMIEGMVVGSVGHLNGVQLGTEGGRWIGRCVGIVVVVGSFVIRFSKRREGIVVQFVDRDTTWGIRFVGDVARWAVSGGFAKSRTVRGKEVFIECFDELGSFVFVCHAANAAFIASYTVEIGVIFGILDEDVELSGVVERDFNISNIGAKLFEVQEQFVVFKDCVVALSRVGSDKGCRLVIEGGVGFKKDGLDGAIAIAVTGADNAMKAAVFGKHVLFGKEAKNGVSHSGDGDFHAKRKIIGCVVANGESSVTAVVGAETPERVGVETIVVTRLDKVGVPCTDASMGVIVAGDLSLHEVLFIGRLDDEQGAVSENKLVSAFQVVQISVGVRSLNSGSKYEAFVKFVLITGRDIGRESIMVEGEDYALGGGGGWCGGTSGGRG